MCGRYVNVAATGDLLREFEAGEAHGDDLAPSWNIAPTDAVRIVVERRPSGDVERQAAPVRQLRTVQWGLLPSWSKSRSGGAKMINARSETVATKPAFKAAAARRRCLVPSLGYYEWQPTDQGKTPWFLHDATGRTLAMAGLYEIWRDHSLAEDDPRRWVWTCTIITRPATDALGDIHDRCPVLVPSDHYEAWLDCTADDPMVAQRLLAAMPEPHLQPTIVSLAVGNVRNNEPELIEPATTPADQDGMLPLPLQGDTPPRPGARG